MRIKTTIIAEIKEYCRVNGISNVDEFANMALNRGFTIAKYGETPSTSQNIPEVIEKEVIKEVIKEVPFEVIKEVEVVKEVEKIVNVADDVEINKLLKKIEDLEASHKETIDLLKKGRMEQTQTIMRLNKEKDLLKEDCDKQLKVKDEQITKLKSSKDFYGE